MLKTDSAPPKQLVRSETDRMLGGVAAGIADYFNLDSAIIRIFFVLFTVFGGSGVIAYLILWVILPSASKTAQDPEKQFQANTAEIKAEARTLTATLPQSKKSHQFWGFFLICLGILFLLKNFGILDWVRFDKLWPLVLILLGVTVFVR